MVKFGPLVADIVSLVWGTPRNFNGFRVLAALLHGTLVVGAGRKKSPFWHQRTTLSGYIFGTKACIDNRKKTCETAIPPPQVVII